jgi:hypothetical protein
MPAILRRHVNFGPGEAALQTGEQLLRSTEITTSEAAALAECSMENIRQWVMKHRVGRWEPRLKMYIVDREKLLARMNRRKPKRKPLAQAK